MALTLKSPRRSHHVALLTWMPWHGSRSWRWSGLCHANVLCVQWLRTAAHQMFYSIRFQKQWTLQGIYRYLSQPLCRQGPRSICISKPNAELGNFNFQFQIELIELNHADYQKVQFSLMSEIPWPWLWLWHTGWWWYTSFLLSHTSRSVQPFDLHTHICIKNQEMHAIGCGCCRLPSLRRGPLEKNMICLPARYTTALYSTTAVDVFCFTVDLLWQ